ncbi:hypothetical protein M514_10754 [Trichuris suis]|uniref:Uncharacterized protein n=1 Tax=Trichuris suis TaxID=68888 RepID=A0A085MQM9_9BILA|nr:hypothetical protein M513_10754 [Trichuris suis]KFD59525.1 hypothetical protein M514_10754 [Trichuris suis]
MHICIFEPFYYLASLFWHMKLHFIECSWILTGWQESQSSQMAHLQAEAFVGAILRGFDAALDSSPNAL